jgi:hypothetical protein
MPINIYISFSFSFTGNIPVLSGCCLYGSGSPSTHSRSNFQRDELYESIKMVCDDLKNSPRITAKAVCVSVDTKTSVSGSFNLARPVT